MADKVNKLAESVATLKSLLIELDVLQKDTSYLRPQDHPYSEKQNYRRAMELSQWPEDIINEPNAILRAEKAQKAGLSISAMIMNRVIEESRTVDQKKLLELRRKTKDKEQEIDKLGQVIRIDLINAFIGLPSYVWEEVRLCYNRRGSITDTDRGGDLIPILKQYPWNEQLLPEGAQRLIRLIESLAEKKFISL